ncbi:unnamed protein product [Porites evermanni]|uniref:Uncharacterized protein n=1 Tax=Porites evermanni TaxID=104178 RepID=A0ABN8PW98_9CNID|nr:unnamed protein product [Porites evermanni]CAH3150075.1 unnamed protein product [Porites evermanni]
MSPDCIYSSRKEEREGSLALRSCKEHTGVGTYLRSCANGPEYLYYSREESGKNWRVVDDDADADAAGDDHNVDSDDTNDTDDTDNRADDYDDNDDDDNDDE